MICWILDYGFAVLWAAWERVRRDRAETARWTREPGAGGRRDALTGGSRSPFPVRIVACLAVVGVLGVSVARVPWAAPWSEDESRPMSVLQLERPPQQVFVAAWSPGTASSALVTLAGGSPEAAANGSREDVEAPAPETNSEDSTPIPTPATDRVAAAESASDTADPPTATAPEPTPEATPAPPPPAATAEPPAPPPPPPAPAQLTRDEMTQAALAAGWPAELVPDLLTVAWCESSFRPAANGWGALGLMQIVPSWFTWLGIDVALATDPVTNLKVAYYIYSHDVERGYAPWSSWACKP